MRLTVGLENELIDFDFGGFRHCRLARDRADQNENEILSIIDETGTDAVFEHEITEYDVEFRFFKQGHRFTQGFGGDDVVVARTI